MSWFDSIFKLLRDRSDAAGQAAVSPASNNERAAGRSTQAKTLFDAGRAAFHGGDYDAASSCFAATLEIRHDHAKAHYYLGLTHLRQNRHEDAADCFTLATHFMPDFPYAIFHLGLDARRRRDYLGAATYFERAIELKPDFAHAHNNLGYTLLTELENYELGAQHIETAMRLHPDDPDVLCNYSAVLLHRGQLEEAHALCNRLLAAHPELDEARLNRALAALKRGRFAEGWADYEARKSGCGNYVPRDFGFPEWDGEPLADKAILVYAEQGLGDQLMFASCLPELLQQVSRCIVECSYPLEKLFRRSFPAATVQAADWASPPRGPLMKLGVIDFQVAIGSLPRHFRAEVKRFPVHRGYLQADSARVAHWRQRVSACGIGPVIGISWRGGAPSTRRGLRSTLLENWLPLLKRQECQFVSLQYGDASAELARLADDHAITIHHWQEAIDDYDETAALMCALDLVISVPTSVVHLAGALGKPAWVMVPAVPEWRYLQSGETMPWYPSMRLFRQQQPNQWQPVIERVASCVAQSRLGRRC